MAKPFRLVDTTFLEKALDASTLRNQVISDNIANANNPEYQAKAVKFDEHLREAVDHEQSVGKPGSFAFKSKLPQHLQIDDIGGWTKENLKPTIESVDGDIDINTEMSSLAKNQILYQAYSSKVTGIYGSLKWIVENSGR